MRNLLILQKLLLLFGCVFLLMDYALAVVEEREIRLKGLNKLLYQLQIRDPPNEIPEGAIRIQKIPNVSPPTSSFLNLNINAAPWCAAYENELDHIFFMSSHQDRRFVKSEKILHVWF
ncbi:hypothetical protein M8J76_015084 [Diaphorina citri]|nr:hypothetical protein M8J76_015084 [Diaphorina citri]